MAVRTALVTMAFTEEKPDFDFLQHVIDFSS